MAEKLRIHPNDMNAEQSLEFQSILNVSRAIFLADGRRESRYKNPSDKVYDLVDSAPGSGGSIKKELEKSKEPGNLPLLRPYDNVSAEIPGFKLATVNLAMMYAAVDRVVDKTGKEVLVLDKSTPYYRATIRHQIHGVDPEIQLKSNHDVPLDELLAPYRSQITELFTYSESPKDVFRHTLDISANWYRPAGELNIDDSLERLALHIAHIMPPATIAQIETPKQTESRTAESLSA